MNFFENTILKDLMKKLFLTILEQKELGGGVMSAAPFWRKSPIFRENVSYSLIPKRRLENLTNIWKSKMTIKLDESFIFMHHMSRFRLLSVITG